MKTITGGSFTGYFPHIPVPAELSTAHDFHGTASVWAQDIQGYVSCRLMSQIRYRTGSQDAGSVAFELCDSGQTPSPL